MHARGEVGDALITQGTGDRPVSMGAMNAHLDRMRAHPDIAGRVLRLEYTSDSLNPQTKLLSRRSLLEQFAPGRDTDRPLLAAFEEELTCPWALYHVRWILSLAKADSTERGRVMRSVERADVGRASALGRSCRASRSGTASPSRSTIATGG